MAGYLMEITQDLAAAREDEDGEQHGEGLSDELVLGHGGVSGGVKRRRTAWRPSRG